MIEVALLVVFKSTTADGGPEYIDKKSTLSNTVHSKHNMNTHNNRNGYKAEAVVHIEIITSRVPSFLYSPTQPS